MSTIDWTSGAAAYANATIYSEKAAAAGCAPFIGKQERDMLLCVRDETPSGQSLYELSLDFLNERITVRELLRERVHHEVKEFNRRQEDPVFRGLVQPTHAEQILNGPRIEYRLKQHRTIDWEAQFARALDGFERNAFFVIVDDHQAESLDQEFIIGPATSVTFVKLVPLVGG
jgi:hypothetical protein